MRSRFAVTAIFQLLALPALAAAQTGAPVPSPKSPATLKFAGSIPLAHVRGRMDHVSVDVAGRRLFAAAYDNHTLEVIDLAAGRQVKSLHLTASSWHRAVTER